MLVMLKRAIDELRVSREEVHVRSRAPRVSDWVWRSQHASTLARVLLVLPTLSVEDAFVAVTVCNGDSEAAAARLARMNDFRREVASVATACGVRRMLSDGLGADFVSTVLQRALPAREAPSSPPLGFDTVLAAMPLVHDATKRRAAPAARHELPAIRAAPPRRARGDRRTERVRAAGARGARLPGREKYSAAWRCRRCSASYDRRRP